MENLNPMEKAVLAATAETLNLPDQKLMKDVSDLINSRSEYPKIAVTAIAKRLMLLRNAKVQALTLELIEYCAYTCEVPFYTQISTNDFLQRLNTLLNPNMNPHMQQRLLQVIFVLKAMMIQHQDIFPAFFAFLLKIQTKTPLPQSYESRYAVLKKAVSYPTSTSGPSKFPSSMPENQKTAKLKRDLETVKSNINLTNEIIDNTNPNDDVNKNDILSDMMRTLRGVEDKLRNLITNMSGNDEGMMSYCLELNDDLVKTFERYEFLKKHIKPAAFKVEQFKFAEVQQPSIQAPPQVPQQQQNAFWGNIQGPGEQKQNQQVPVEAPKPVIAPPPKQIDLLNLFEDDPPQVDNSQQKQQIQVQKEKEVANLFDITLDEPAPQQQQPQQQQQQQQQVPQNYPPQPVQPVVNPAYQAFNPPQQLYQQQYPPQQQQFPPQQQYAQYPPQYQTQPQFQQQFPQQQTFQQQQAPQNVQPNISNLYQQQQQLGGNSANKYAALSQPYQQAPIPQFQPQQYTSQVQPIAQPKNVLDEFDDILKTATQQPKQQNKPVAPTDLF